MYPLVLEVSVDRELTSIESLSLAEILTLPTNRGFVSKLLQSSLFWFPKATSFGSFSPENESAYLSSAVGRNYFCMNNNTKSRSGRCFQPDERITQQHAGQHAGLIGLQFLLAFYSRQNMQQVRRPIRPVSSMLQQLETDYDLELHQWQQET
jgi:hypothetical protein